MKYVNIISFSLLIVIVLFGSCKKKQSIANNIPQSENSLTVKYADGFSIYYHDDYKEVIVYNPWEKGTVYTRYYLIDNKEVQTPENGVKIITPLKTIALTSVTQIEFLNLIDELHTVSGICSPELIYNEAIRNGIDGKKITDLGDAFSLNVERVLLLNPEALMTSGYNQNDPNVFRVEKAQIPVLYNNEWMETSLLARAEWIKFASVFYNKEDVADSIFSEIERRYTETRDKAKNVLKKPSILSGSSFRGTWYMPGGRSFMGKLFADAGAEYFYANDTTMGSLPLNVETVLMNFSDADVWLNCGYDNIDELKKADSKNALFRPVQLDKVYNFNKRRLPSGANDFWESAVARPDLLLADVIKILHPDILPEHELVYAEKLK